MKAQFSNFYLGINLFKVNKVLTGLKVNYYLFLQKVVLLRSTQNIKQFIRLTEITDFLIRLVIYF